ncbi:MAG: class I SAM-dependent methyltransferase [Elusimicrobiota bacterium]
MSDFDPFLPENLLKQEQAEISAVESGQDASRGDFGAYHRLLKHHKDDWVRLHAIIDAAAAAQYAEQAAAALASLAPPSGRPNLLDAGCGPGAITDALRVRVGCSAATGVDISQSAIEYARRSFPLCRFNVVAIDEHTTFPERYDIIHSREFYPFTRTVDLAVHKAYLNVFAKHLKPGGILVCTLLDQPGTLSDTICELRATMESMGLTPFKAIPLANARLLRLLRSVALSRGATWAVNKLIKAPQRCFYLSRLTRSPS